jgi:hypothetical protein
LSDRSIHLVARQPEGQTHLFAERWADEVGCRDDLRAEGDAYFAPGRLYVGRRFVEVLRFDVLVPDGAEEVG